MPANILVVDDHDATRELIESILSRRGYEVRTADSGPEGLELIEQNIPDLILLDYNMPGMDGFEVLAIIRKKPDMAQTPVIMFTAKSEPTTKLTGFNLGANDFLTKPTSPKELLRRVEVQLTRAEEMPAENIPSPPISTSPPPQSPLSPQKPSRQLIAIMGARGGVGTTITAINIATCLAQAEKSTLLADLDVTQGHIAAYLRYRVTEGLNKLASLNELTLQHEVESQIHSVQDNLHFLLSKSNIAGTYPTLAPAQIDSLIKGIDTGKSNIIFDLGRGISPLGSEVLKEASHAIICICPDRLSLSAGKQLVQKIKKSHPSLQITILLNDFRQRRGLPRESIEQFLGHPVFDVMKINENHLVQAVNTGQSLVAAYPDSDIVAQYQKLGQFLIQEHA